MGVFYFEIEDPSIPGTDWKLTFSRWLDQALKVPGNLRIAEQAIVRSVLLQLKTATTALHLEPAEAQFLLWAFLNLHVSADNNRVYLEYVDRLIKACN